MTYESEYGNKLVYEGPRPTSRPVLTVEECSKWYALYLVNIDGTVSTIEWGELESYADGVTYELNHYVHPRIVKKLCHARGYDLDAASLALIEEKWKTADIGAPGPK